MRNPTKLLGIGLAFLACFAFGFTWRDLSSGSAPSTRALGALVGVKTSGPVVSATEVFRASFGKILGSYYKPIEPRDLKYAGIEGLMASLGDPHTVFMEPRIAQEFALETRANFMGIGARLDFDPLGAKVVVVFEGGPADKAGLKAGDTITHVDGESMLGKIVEDIVTKIRGEEGTTVRLKLIRQGAAKPIEIRPRRAKIITPTVEQRVFEKEQIGYIGVASFSEPTSEQFARAMDTVEAEGVKGIVIDLRNNPGGLLETAVEMLSLFAEDKVVVKMRMRDGREEIAKTYVGAKRKKQTPIVVLMNEESASAAEIFAGALRDYKLATVVGEHSYGKASVQNVYSLIDGSSAKITIARYFLPSGADISRRVDDDGVYLSGGIEADVKAEIDLNVPFVYSDPVKDSQLAKAIAVLKKKAG